MMPDDRAWWVVVMVAIVSAIAGLPAHVIHSAQSAVQINQAFYGEKAALLEFVDFSGLTFVDVAEGACILTDAQVQRAEAQLPEAAEAPAYNEYTCADGSPALLRDGAPFHTVMTGAGIARARAEKLEAEGGQWAVNFTLALESEKAQAFVQYIANHPNEMLGIVWDGRLLSAPVIFPDLSDSARAGTMTGGLITGNFTRDEATLLAAQLNGHASSNTGAR